MNIRLIEGGETSRVLCKERQRLRVIPFLSVQLHHPHSCAANRLPVIKADCIRYAIAFRSILPPEALVSLINLAPHLLSASAPAVHSYAAVLLEKLLAMKSPAAPTDPL